MPLNTNDRRCVFWVGTLLSALAVLLTAFQYITVGAAGALAPAHSFVSIMGYVNAVNDHVEFFWYDGCLAALIVAVALALTICEIRVCGLTRFLLNVFDSDRRTLMFLSLASAVCARFYLAPGVFSWSADQAQHISFSHITAFAFAHGELPIWTNYLGCGTPYLQFYGFLFFYLVGLIDLLFGEIYSSLKVVLFLSHVGSGVAMYLFVRTASRSRRAGFIAGIAYVLSFWHTQQVLIMGRLPLSLFYALLPLAFYFAERTLTRRHGFSDLLFGGIILGLLAFTHPGYGVWATALTAFYCAARLLRRPAGQTLGKSATRAILLLTCGLAFGSYLTLPMWLEREATGLYRGISFVEVADPSWRHVFVWSNYRFWVLPFSADQFHWYGGYVGMSLFAVTAVGAVTPWLRRVQVRFGPETAIYACLAFAALLVFGYRLALVQALPLVEILGSGRYLLFFIFFLAAASGIATKQLWARRLSALSRTRVVAFVLLVVGWDLVPTTVQHPYATGRTDKDAWGNDLENYRPLRENAEELQRHSLLPPHRVYWAWGEIHPYLAEGQLYYNTLTPIPHAHHPGDVRAVHDFVKPIEHYLNVVFPDMPPRREDIFLSEDFALINGSIAMLNAKYVFANLENEDAIIGMQWAYSTPALVSPKLTAYTDRDSAYWQANPELVPARLRNTPTGTSSEVLAALEIVELTGVGFLENKCRQILARGITNNQNLGTVPSLEVVDHVVSNQNVRMTVDLTSPAFVRLAYSYFPHLRVTVDGVEVTPYETAGRFVALHLDSGKHVITLEPQLSTLRAGLLLLAFAILGTACWGYMREKRRLSLPGRS